MTPMRRWTRPGKPRSASDGTGRVLGSGLAGMNQGVLFYVDGAEKSDRKICIVDFCDLPRKARGYCNRHYLQVVFYGQEATGRLRYDTTVRDKNGRKRCASCEKWRPENDFHKSNKCKDGRASTCTKCYRTKYNAIQRHGITVEFFNAMLERQGGQCICGSSGPFVIDHDHSCCNSKTGCAKCVRGVICQPCNKTLAFSRDNSALLRRLADYLDRGRQ